MSGGWGHRAAVFPALADRSNRTPAGRGGRRCEQVVATLLFADIQGFSRLRDPEMSAFVVQFQGQVASLAGRYREAIVVRETWGDGLFFALLSVEAAGNLALALSELAQDTAWQIGGFARSLPLRIALHVGPVQLGRNPVTGLASCSGADVSRAARLEPKTPPGQVYASETFAEWTVHEQVRGFACHFVREIPWAKRSGTFPTYVVRRTRRVRPRLRVVRAEGEAETWHSDRVKCQ